MEPRDLPATDDRLPARLSGRSMRCHLRPSRVSEVTIMHRSLLHSQVPPTRATAITTAFIIVVRLLVVVLAAALPASHATAATQVERLRTAPSRSQLQRSGATVREARLELGSLKPMCPLWPMPRTCRSMPPASRIMVS